MNVSAFFLGTARKWHWSPFGDFSGDRRPAGLEHEQSDDASAASGLPGAFGSGSRTLESPSGAPPPVASWRCTMQRLRETFRRCKGPAIESHLPISVSLEVPKQVRSASFDEIRFKKEHDRDNPSADNLLAVPSNRNQRSRSFDSATTASSGPSSSVTVEMAAQSVPSVLTAAAATSSTSVTGSQGGSSLSVPSPPPSATEAPYQLDVPKWRLLRRSSSDKSQCSCIHCQYMDEYSRSTSRSNSPQERLRYFSSGSETLEESESEGAASRPDEDQGTDAEEDLLVSPTSCGLMVTLSVPDSGHRLSIGGDAGVTVVSLQVPQVSKQVRSASVDSSFLQVPTPDPDLDPDLAAKAQRSRSVDIVLPTGAEPRYALCQPKERGHARYVHVFRHNGLAGFGSEVKPEATSLHYLRPR